MAERQASVSAQDLKTSSDFLMKSGPLFDSLRFSLAFCSLLRMESSGHSPSSELLDKALSLIFSVSSHDQILDLYSNQKPKEVKKPKERCQSSAAKSLRGGWKRRD